MSLRLAFSKDKWLSSCIRLFEPCGLRAPQAFYNGRVVVHKSSALDVECFLVRDPDVAWLLDQGYVDAALASSLCFEEYSAHDLVLVAGLELGRCRLSLITLNGKSADTITSISTRYPKTAARLLNGIYPSAPVTVLRGCVEVALFLGLSDAIVDIVETGFTLDNLGLHEHQTLLQISHGIWMRRDQLGQLPRLQALLPSVVDRFTDQCSQIEDTSQH